MCVCEGWGVCEGCVQAVGVFCCQLTCACIIIVMLKYAAALCAMMSVAI